MFKYVKATCLGLAKAVSKANPGMFVRFASMDDKAKVGTHYPFVGEGLADIDLINVVVYRSMLENPPVQSHLVVVGGRASSLWM